MENKKPLNTKDIVLMNKMTEFIIGIHSDIVYFCLEKCPYISNCKDFTGACAIQTVKSVANWGWRILIEQTSILERAAQTADGKLTIRKESS